MQRGPKTQSDQSDQTKESGIRRLADRSQIGATHGHVHNRKLRPAKHGGRPIPARHSPTTCWTMPPPPCPSLPLCPANKKYTMRGRREGVKTQGSRSGTSGASTQSQGGPRGSVQIDAGVAIGQGQMPAAVLGGSPLKRWGKKAKGERGKEGPRHFGHQEYPQGIGCPRGT